PRAGGARRDQSEGVREQQVVSSRADFAGAPGGRPAARAGDGRPARGGKNPARASPRRTRAGATFGAGAGRAEEGASGGAGSGGEDGAAGERDRPGSTPDETTRRGQRAQSQRADLHR